MLALFMSIGMNNSARPSVGFNRARHFVLSKLGSFRVPKLKGVLRAPKPLKIKAIKMPKIKAISSRGFPK